MYSSTQTEVSEGNDNERKSEYPIITDLLLNDHAHGVRLTDAELCMAVEKGKLLSGVHIHRILSENIVTKLLQETEELVAIWRDEAMLSDVRYVADGEENVFVKVFF